MKNLFILIVLGLLALTSCKKEYTCECKYTDSAYPGISFPFNSSTIKDTKKNAEEECDKGDDSYTDEFDDLITIDCEIK